MSSAQKINSDDSLLSRLDRLFFALEAPLNLLSGITVLCIMLLAVANVLGRKLFNMPIPGFIDWMEQLVPVAAFLGLAYCQRLGGHIRMDMVVGALRRRALWAAEFISILFMIFVISALIYGSWDHFSRGYRLGDSTVDINLPLWPAKLVVPVMLSLLLIRLLLQLWAYGRAFIRNDEFPVAVPLIEDAAQQAAEEASTVSGGTQ